MARKPVPVDPEELEKLAAMHCTQEEVAAWFSKPGATLTHQAVSKKLKQEPYRTIWETGWAKGNISLRRKQMQAAENGDRTMLVWLGKQWLGQTDTQRTEHTGRDGGPIEVTDADRKRAEDILTEQILEEAERIARGASEG
jgi:hypothetical protein